MPPPVTEGPLQMQLRLLETATIAEICVIMMDADGGQESGSSAVLEVKDGEDLGSPRVLPRAGC